jgi:hypothetical protein
VVLIARSAEVLQCRFGGLVAFTPEYVRDDDVDGGLFNLPVDEL